MSLQAEKIMIENTIREYDDVYIVITSIDNDERTLIELHQLNNKQVAWIESDHSINIIDSYLDHNHTNIEKVVIF